MSMYLERYSFLKAPIQGRAVQKLVGRQGHWLKEVQPDTVQRYRDYPHAVKSIIRLTGDELFKAFIIRERKSLAAHGLATIIANQYILHPNMQYGGFIGSDLDYWLEPGATLDQHREVADELVEASTDDNVFATVPEYHPNKPLGLMGARAGHSANTLTKVGGPAEIIRVPELLEDPYGITRNGVPVDLYYRR